MIEFKKGRRSLYLFLAGIVLTIGVLVSWLVLTIQSNAVIVGDVILLSILFVILLGGELAMLVLYFRRPNILLKIDETNVYIHLSKKKVVEVPIAKLSTINLNRQLLYIVTVESNLYSVRFLENPREANRVIKEKLNEFITNNPDAYFNNLPKK